MGIRWPVPKPYQQHLIYLQVRLGILAFLVLLGLGAAVGYFRGEPLGIALIKNSTGACVGLILGLLALLDQNSSWDYVINETGISFASNSGFYGALLGDICRAKWDRQTLVNIQPGEWRGRPALWLCLAKKGDPAKRKGLMIVYQPEDEEKVIREVVPRLQQQKMPATLQ